MNYLDVWYGYFGLEIRANNTLQIIHIAKTKAEKKRT